MNPDIAPAPNPTTAAPQSNGQAIDVVTASVSVSQPPVASSVAPAAATTTASHDDVVPAPANNEPSSTSDEAKHVETSPKTTQPATPAKPKMKTTVPLAAIVVASVIFTLLAVLAFLAYSKGA